MTNTVSLMETIRRRCPLLSERMTADDFLSVLAGRNIYCTPRLLERALEFGALEPLTPREGEAENRFSRGHLLVVYQLSRHSRIDWYPWDDARADREDLMARRIASKRTMWAEIASDSGSVDEFMNWFWGDDIASFPASTAVRITQIVRYSIKNIDSSGHLLAIARANPEHRGHGPLLLITEMVKLRTEVEQLLANAAEAGIHIPDANEVTRDRDRIAAESKADDDENPLYAAPPESAAEDARARFLATRDMAIRTSDWAELASIYAENEELFTSDEDAEYALRTAQGVLYSEHLEASESAIRVWCRVLDLRAGDARAITHLDSLLDRAAWEKLLAEQAESVEDEELSGALLLARANVLVSDLDRFEDSLQAFGIALGEGSGETREDALSLLETVIRSGEADPTFDIIALDLIAGFGNGDVTKSTMSELSELIEARELSSEQRAELLLSRSDLHSSEGNLDKAFVAATRALAADPGRERSHELLDELSDALGNTEELQAILEDELERAKGVEARAIVARHLGEVTIALGDRTRALEALELAHELAPEGREQVVLLAELYREDGRLKEALGMLEALHRLSTDPEERAAIGEVLADVRSQALDSPEVALETYSKMLRTGEGRDEAVAGLLRIAHDAGPEIAFRATRGLDSEISGGERDQELVDLYTRLLDEHADALAKQDRLHALERVCQLLGRDKTQKRLAIRRHAQLYALRADPATLASAKSLLAGKADFEHWARSIEGELGAADKTLRPRLLRQVARTYEEQVRDPESARRTWQRLLAIEPSDRNAYNALRKRLVAARQWDELVELEFGWAEAVPEERDGRLLEVGRVLSEEVGDLRGAFLVYGQLLDGTPDHPEAVAASEALLERDDVPVERRVEVLEEAEGQSSGALWLKLRLRRVSVLAANGQTDGALRLLADAAQQRPDEGAILDRMEALQRQNNLWGPLEATLKRRIDVSEGDAGRHFTKELANLYIEQLGRPDEGRKLLAGVEAEERDVAAAVEEQARDREARQERYAELESAVENAEDDSRAARALVVLAAAIGADGDRKRASSILTDGVKSTASPDIRATLLCALADHAEAESNAAQAESFLKAALSLRSQDLEILDALIGFYRRQSALPKLFALLKFRLSRTQDASASASLLAEQANVAQRMGDLEAARAALSELLERGERGNIGLDRVAIKRNLAGLLVRSGDRDAGVASLESLAEELSGTPAQADVLADLAALHLAAGEMDRAGARVEEGLEAHGDHLRLQVMRIDLFVEAESLEDAYDAALVLSREHQTRAMVAPLAKLARLFASRSEQARAATLYRRLQELDPDNSEAKTFLGVSVAGSGED